MECDKVEAEDTNKLVCRRRKILYRLNATEIMKAFGRHEALSVLHLVDKRKGRIPPEVIEFLKTGKETKDHQFPPPSFSGTSDWRARWAICCTQMTYDPLRAGYDAYRDALKAALADACPRTVKESDELTRDLGDEASKLLETMVEEFRSGVREWEWKL